VSAVVYALMLAAALGGWAVVAARDPRKQVFALSANGLVLTALFLALQAPDVALSELAVGVVAVPLLFLVALGATRPGEED
jgi:uncharacterized MnhB-related membrane protein